MRPPPLSPLIAALHGTPPDPADWPGVIEVANRSWLTPALFVALRRSGGLEELPHEPREYLTFIHDRNRERNLRLRAQLVEAIGAMNRVGIRPVVLKGAGILLSSSEAEIGARMMSDLDLMVEDTGKPAADDALAALGYRNLPDLDGVWRPQDVGALELHRAVDLAASYGPAVISAATPSVVSRHGAEAWLPSPTFRTLHLILHDQVKDGDYWRGSIDLRHLCDLAALADGVDWPVFRSVLSADRWRNAVETQLLTLHRLFGTAVPEALRSRLVPRLQHWRRMAQIRYPVLASPLREAGAVAWIGRRIRTGKVPTFTPTDFTPRIVRKLLQGRRKTMEALMGIHLGPKL